MGLGLPALYEVSFWAGMGVAFICLCHVHRIAEIDPRLPRSPLLGFGPAPVGDFPDPFLDRNELVRGDLLEILVSSAWPTHLDVHRRRGPQAEMQSRVAAGEKA